MSEVWKQIEGWEYEVSDLGQVRSMPRIRPTPTKGIQHHKGRILKPFLCEGYPQVRLCRPGLQKQFAIHRLVLETFVGPAPVGHECLHRDDIRSNAQLSNLRWGTKAENKADRARNDALHLIRDRDPEVMLMMNPSQELVERCADLENRIAKVLRHIDRCAVLRVEPSKYEIYATLCGADYGD